MTCSTGRILTYVVVREKLKKTYKEKHLKTGSGQPLSYSSEQDDQVLSRVLKQRDFYLPQIRRDI